jgi:predicted DNA-binding protein with PD1-like motif
MADPAASLGKIIVKQLPSNEDLIQNIKKLCIDNGIRYAKILSVVGSLRKLTVECIVVSEINESGFDFGPPRVFAGPLQILSLAGIIFENEAGEMDAHLHGTFSDSDGNVFGGHILEGENPVATRLVIVIGEIAGVSMIEKYDKESGHMVLHVEER